MAAQQIALGAQLGQIVGVFTGGLLQRRVRQPGRLLAELADLPRQVQTLGTYQHLHRSGEGVQVTAKGGGQGLLLGRGAQGEVDGGAHRQGRDPVCAEVDHAGLGDVFGGELQLGRSNVPLGAGVSGVAGDPAGQPGRGREDAFGSGDSIAGAHALADGSQR
ncbi:hypothetical protein SVIO_102840 [Streptomyces violaceusniger]|uniref:Uncharacterized protein n=1 Tax=Streptomyces violaceusniger TaxID=68280 RepID=A0A4D4LDK3_STRVO|nr:hypothetical protein SVIO_102840 [Streptomyces violaceusniger]